MPPIPLSTFVRVLFYLLSENAIIYGQTVRDMLVQKKAEKIYREKKYPQSMFYHSMYMAHLSNRFKYPSTIEFCLPDCCDAERVHENISKIFNCLHHYNWYNYSGDYTCSYTDKYGAVFEFYQTPELPQSVDFECNGLVLKTVSDLDIEVDMIPSFVEQGKDLNKILDDIRYKTATIHDATPYQVAEMHEVGWNVTEREIYEPPLHECVEEEKTCVICHDTIGLGEHVKRSCCNADYHAACMGKVLSYYDRCPHCRDIMG